MARLGKRPITIPAGVSVVQEKSTLTVKGPKGELARAIPAQLSIIVADDGRTVMLAVLDEVKNATKLLGTITALLRTMMEGVTNGFMKVLELEGVGYRASMEGKDLLLSLGFSHPVRFVTPEGISMKVEKSVIEISGTNKELVGQVAAHLRDLKPPEPYKGKGIRYHNEYIRRKAGKKAVASG